MKNIARQGKDFTYARDENGSIKKTTPGNDYVLIPFRKYHNDASRIHDLENKFSSKDRFLRGIISFPLIGSSDLFSSWGEGGAEEYDRSFILKKNMDETIIFYGGNLKDSQSLSLIFEPFNLLWIVDKYKYSKLDIWIMERTILVLKNACTKYLDYHASVPFASSMFSKHGFAGRNRVKRLLSKLEKLDSCLYKSKKSDISIR